MERQSQMFVYRPFRFSLSPVPALPKVCSQAISKGEGNPKRQPKGGGTGKNFDLLAAINQSQWQYAIDASTPRATKL